MKLKEFNTENSVSHRGHKNGPPSLGITFSSGLVTINKAAAELLSLKAGDQVVILQDADEETDWYLEKVKTKGFPLRQMKEGNGSLLFNNAHVTKIMADSMTFTGKSGRILIAGQPTKLDKRNLWALLTAGLRNV